jgi:hypothetical protein
MGIVERNGRSYYYRSKRVGGRVVSEYVGSGPLVPLAAQLDLATRHRATMSRIDERTRIEEAEKADREQEAAFDRAEDVFRSLMVAAGFNQHARGDWRRSRGQ